MLSAASPPVAPSWKFTNCRESPGDTLLAIGSEKGAVYVLKCEA